MEKLREAHQHVEGRLQQTESAIDYLRQDRLQIARDLLAKYAVHLSANMQQEQDDARTLNDITRTKAVLINYLKKGHLLHNRLVSHTELAIASHKKTTADIKQLSSLTADLQQDIDTIESVDIIHAAKSLHKIATLLDAVDSDLKLFDKSARDASNVLVQADIIRHLAYAFSFTVKIIVFTMFVKLFNHFYSRNG